MTGIADDSAARLKGIALICAALVMFSVLDTSAKFASRYVPTLEVAWVRYTLGFVFSLIGVRAWRDPRAYLTRRPGLQALRSLFLLGSTLLNFMALRTLQLAEAVSITFAAPLIVTAFAGPVLGEWAGPRRWAAVIVGFVGVMIVIQPEPANFRPEALFSVGAAICYSGYALTTRLLSATETPASLLIYGSLSGVILLAPALPGIGVWPPDWLVGLALVMTGIAAGIGHWWLIAAYRNAPATVLQPFSYTQIIWMIAAGYFFFGDIPKLTTLIGAAIVIASGLYILYRERVRRDR